MYCMLCVKVIQVLCADHIQYIFYRFLSWYCRYNFQVLRVLYSGIVNARAMSDDSFVKCHFLSAQHPSFKNKDKSQNGRLQTKEKSCRGLQFAWCLWRQWLICGAALPVCPFLMTHSCSSTSCRPLSDDSLALSFFPCLKTPLWSDTSCLSLSDDSLV